MHGITENRHTWDPIVAGLAAGHRVLRVDLRGHGESPVAASYGVAEMAADIADLVDEPPLLVGHSLGGMVVTAYAAQFPCRGVVDIDQSLDLAPLQAGLVAQAALLRSEAFPMVMDALFDSLRGEVDDAGWQRLGALRRYDQDVVLGVWGIILDTTPEQLAEVVKAITTGIDVPYLALHGINPVPATAAGCAAGSREPPSRPGQASATTPTWCARAISSPGWASSRPACPPEGAGS